MIFDVAMLTETWFESTSDVFTIPQYKSYYMNRVGKRGGGVCMMISNEIQCELLPDYSSVTPDYEIVTVKSGSHIVSACYRPPGGDDFKFNCLLDSFLEFVNSHNYQVILGGDLNINLLSEHNPRNELVTILNLHLCHNAIASPTRITENSETLLGLFITNFDVRSVIGVVIAYAISDHLPIFISIQLLRQLKICTIQHTDVSTLIPYLCFDNV